jgi:predicted DNA-binding transcriptional regulator AlpA
MDESAKYAEGSYGLDEWCVRRRISRAMFYKLAAQGLAPKTHKVGARRLISAEADLAWVRAREAENQNTAA